MRRREIVGAQIGSYVTNDPGTILAAIKSGCRDIKLLDRRLAERMMAYNFNPLWPQMATGPALYVIDENGEIQEP